MDPWSRRDPATKRLTRRQNAAEMGQLGVAVQLGLQDADQASKPNSKSRARYTSGNYAQISAVSLRMKPIRREQKSHGRVWLQIRPQQAYQQLVRARQGYPGL